jgi:hypothetical protein
MTTKEYTWDENLSLEKTTTLKIYAGSITSYNGVEVQWGSKPFFGTLYPHWLLLTLPAGDTELVVNYKDNQFSGKNLNFSYFFEAGKSYKLTIVHSKEYKAYVMGVFNDEAKRLIPKKEDFIAEIPFR